MDGIGYRVARWRDIGGMTQRQLADALGVTRAYISMIENGKKPVTKRSLLIAMARALGVSITDLTAQPYEPDNSEPGYAAIHSAVPLIRTALTGRDDPVRPRPVEQLAAAADSVLVARMACDYATLARILPDLIAESAALVKSGEDRALSPAVKACVTGSLALKNLGWVDLAARLADRAADAARTLADPVHAAAATFAVAQAARAEGSRQQSLEIAEGGLRALGDQSGGDGLSWAGMLHLHCALAAAGLPGGGTAASGAHLDEAGSIARHAVADGWWMEFSAAGVGTWRVSVALEDGEPDRAPEYARRVNMGEVRSVRRRAELMLGSGYGHYAAGRPDDAVISLLEADAISAADVRNRPTVREIVAKMVRDAPARGGSAALRTLAVRCRIDPTDPEVTPTAPGT